MLRRRAIRLEFFVESASNFPSDEGCSEGPYRYIEKLVYRPSLDVDTQDSCGWTALMYAYRNKHPHVVSLLLPLASLSAPGLYPGANRRIKDNDGLTVIEKKDKEGDSVQNLVPWESYLIVVKYTKHLNRALVATVKAWVNDEKSHLAFV